MTVYQCLLELDELGYLKPNKQLRLVTEVANSKLQVGNTFSCRVIAQGQPLIVDHLHTGDSEYDGYVIGGKNGLTIVERIR